MKPAVFEISDGEGVARLVCVSVATLGEATELEAVLRRQLPGKYVRLLGRFDGIKIASDLAEFMDFATGPDFVGQGGFEGRMRRLMRS
jgi:hypothetical protein